MALPSNVSRMNIYCDDETRHEIERYAQKMGVTRPKMTMRLVRLGLDDVKALEAVGLSGLAFSPEEARKHLGGDKND